MRFFLQFLRVFFLLFALNTSVSASDSPPRLFMTIADIHFDPFVNCGWKTCPLIDKLKRASAQDWPAILQVNDKKMSGYGQDSDYLLLRFALKAAAEKAAAQHVQFVLVLGDFLGHDYRKKYKKYTGDTSRADYQLFVRKTFEFINAELAKAFPSTDVYMVPGNNDSYQNNYVSDPNGAFYHDMNALWPILIKNNLARSAMRNQFSTAGYYALTLPDQSNLRLIVLNSVLFSYKARGRNIDQAAQRELNWLDQELQAAKINHQKVILALHIPPEIDIYAGSRLKLFTFMKLWKETYIQRFQAEITRFAPQVAGILAGHLHSNWFHILTLNNQDIPITGTPSISPIFGNAPGFKIYSYSPNTLAIDNVETYYYPLSEMKRWELSYDF